MNHDFAHIRRSLRLLERAAADRLAARQRQSCPHFEVCNGGCPHQRMIEERHDPEFRTECCGRGELVEHLAACDGATGPSADIPVTLRRGAVTATRQPA